MLIFFGRNNWGYVFKIIPCFTGEEDVKRGKDEMILLMLPFGIVLLYTREEKMKRGYPSTKTQKRRILEA